MTKNIPCPKILRIFKILSFPFSTVYSGFLKITYGISELLYIYYSIKYCVSYVTKKMPRVLIYNIAIKYRVSYVT